MRDVGVSLRSHLGTLNPPLLDGWLKVLAEYGSFGIVFWRLWDA